MNIVRCTILSASLLTLASCQGMPIDGFNQPPNVWVLPACLIFCTSHIGKEDVTSTNSPGATSGGGITSSSTSGGNTTTGGDKTQ
jgi:hypothetical protein